MSDTTTIKYAKDAEGVVTLTLDDPSASANTMTEQFGLDFENVAAQLKDEGDALAGVVLVSAKSTFFAGGNLDDLLSAGPDDAAELAQGANRMKAAMRTLETLGKPVVSVIDGAALGGGLEIALATHRRIATQNKKIKVGLPEVTLGLLPGGGGVVRVTRLLGVMNGLMNVLLQGQQMKVAKAVELGLIDEVVADADAGVTAARQWIKDNPEAVQPYDVKGYRVPGGVPSMPSFQAMAPAIGGNLKKQLKGADYHAPKAIAAVAYESLQVPIDRAFEIETRYFVDLVCHSPQSKNMTQAFFFDLQAINKGASRPDGFDQRFGTKVAVLGAGMMGAGIAYQCALVGMEVILKDVSQEGADKGKAYSEALVAKGIKRGKVTPEKGQALLDRITATDSYQDCAGADVVIEAVFESVELKHKVFAEIEKVVAPDALLCSNTSTLPITILAEGVSDPTRFVGLHYFSPVDKMPLIEIIAGDKTSDETLARAFDQVTQQRKTPIIVNDSPGFFTSRVIGTFINEAVAMVSEGISPVLVERAGEAAGYPAAPLQLMDELTLTLPLKIEGEAIKAAAAAGVEYDRHPGMVLVETMAKELGREGKFAGKGFYDYADGKRTRLWPGLAENFGGEKVIPLQDAIDRMLFAEALETVKCFDEGVLRTFEDANIGSIFGIGFPAWTGGVAQYIDQYEGGTTGFVARCKELADAYGDRFVAPASLIEKADQGEPLRPRR
ncbi:MAG: 3-hydroxyacyl-CoA dehydrogenase/enoyl-CoA hydratase/3-hydroxybutyryl-CoA epimerase [Nitriliruptoraceae bacterium]|jgi:3-hydroxyacyl-CoA dehydrogenase/enoyl-CoA hydratase/3-hydroxybutyryl-CoA epimerase